MGYVVKMPKLGLEMDKGTVTRWAVDPGDDVSEGDVIAEIESEKTSAEIDAREGGVLREVFLQEGDAIEPGGAIGIVAGADEVIDDLLADVDGAEAASEDTGSVAAAATETAAEAEAEMEADAAEEASRTSADAGQGQSASAQTVRASPRAKKRAEELGIDLGTVEGSGPQGAISAEDVVAAADAATEEARGSAGASESVKASPRAKKRADELGVDLGAVDGSGPQGAITEDDVESAAAAEPAEPAAPSQEAESAAEPSTGERVFASPSARRLARELGVDIDRLAGGGPSGRITEADVRQAADGEATQSQQTAGQTAQTTESGRAEPPGTRDEERPFSGMRRTIAGRLGESYRDAVHVTIHRTAEAENLLDAASAAKEAFGGAVSVSDVLLVCLSATLDHHPAFNATFEDDVHALRADHDICVAVDVDAGLVAPVIRDVGSRSVSGLAEERRRVTDRALSGEFSMEDLSGGTFTVSNLGVLGVESFDPVINPPQVAILGVDTIEKKVVPAEDDEVAVRRVVGFDLSFDHRVVDGADAARFMQTFVEFVEEPWPALLNASSR